jgi:histidine ammonia-lyase
MLISGVNKLIIIMHNVFKYGGDNLSISLALDICNGKCKGHITDSARSKIRKNRSVVENMAYNMQQVYGINTGFGPKEGLALINGTQFMLTHAVKIAERLQNCLDNADIIAAMNLETMLGSVKAFDKTLHQLRPYKGNIHVADRIRILLKNSQINASHKNCSRVQDPYSIRCIPQVHGASRNAWSHLKEIISIELNSVTDNPVILDNGTAINGGNFHGQPIALPGFVDCHTHICYAGSRESDYAKRFSGKSYLEIARQGGGIWDTVTKTRAASIGELQENTAKRVKELLNQGITTAEVKSGYCLNVEGELKMLKAINQANANVTIDLIPTCLAAHMPPKDFKGSPLKYLEIIIKELLPVIKKERLTSRIDIYVEEGAFSLSDADVYLKSAKEKGFDLIIHADQFSVGGSKLAVKYQARSADHLEVSSGEEIKILAQSNVIPVVLPGALKPSKIWKNGQLIKNLILSS